MNSAPRRRLVCASMGLGLAAIAWRAHGCEVQAEFLRVTHPWSRATEPAATRAVLCMRIDEVTLADRLVGVATPVAKGAEMGGDEPGRPVDVALEPGQLLDMHDSGTHLVLTGLRHQLHAGRDYPLTLMFERSGTVLARLSVDFPALRFARPPS